MMDVSRGVLMQDAKISIKSKQEGDTGMNTDVQIYRLVSDGISHSLQAGSVLYQPNFYRLVPAMTF